MPTKEEIIEVLKKCMDPEIDIDVWSLGIIYNIDIDGVTVNIKMTFTSPACPYGPALVSDIKEKVGKLDSVNEVKVEVVFEPVWEPSEELKAMLGL